MWDDYVYPVNINDVQLLKGLTFNPMALTATSVLTSQNGVCFFLSQCFHTKCNRSGNLPERELQLYRNEIYTGDINNDNTKL